MKSAVDPKSGAPIVIPLAIVMAIVKSAVWFGSLQMAGRFGFTPAAGEVVVAADVGAAVAMGAAVAPAEAAGAAPGLVPEHKIPRSVSGLAVFTFTAPWL